MLSKHRSTEIAPTSKPSVTSKKANDEDPYSRLSFNDNTSYLRNLKTLLIKGDEPGVNEGCGTVLVCGLFEGRSYLFTA